MKPLFEQVAIMGVGFLGGSLARACRKRGLARRIVGFGRNSENLNKARERGFIDDAYSDARSAAKETDLAIVCTPVGSSVALVREMMPALKKGSIVMDIGSVKAPLVRAIEDILPESISFVGAHPIAGGEKSGFEASDPDLFDGARCIITPTARTNRQALDRIVDFWKKLDSTPLLMDMEEHDIIYGAVSHLPHIIAYALANTVADLRTKNHHEAASFCGNGFKDITRLASSEPVMWRDICLANKTAVLQAIDRFQDNLDQIKSAIDQGKADYLTQTFAAANQFRQNLRQRNE